MNLWNTLIKEFTSEREIVAQTINGSVDAVGYGKSGSVSIRYKEGCLYDGTAHTL